MGILNVTHDSFSDGGQFWHDETGLNKSAILQYVQDNPAMTVLDIGAESTRPGASNEPPPAQQECDRLLPAIALLKKHCPQLTLSIDTRQAKVAHECLKAGAHWINDVSGLQHEGPCLLKIIARHQARLVVMHSPPQHLHEANTLTATALLDEILDFLRQKTAQAQHSGIPAAQLIWDVGLGFGKTTDQNLALMKALPMWVARAHEAGCQLLVGPSRKRFLTLGHEAQFLPAQRDALTAMAALACQQAKVDIIRVHPVQVLATALQLWQACQPE